MLSKNFSVFWNVLVSAVNVNILCFCFVTTRDTIAG